MILKSRTLILRPYNKKDAKDLYENFNDRKVTRFMSGAKHPYTLRDARKWIEDSSIKSRQKPIKEMIWAIEHDKNFCGGISLKKIRKHKAELGYWLGRRHWGKGIMAEAVKIVTDLGFRRLKLKRVYAYVFEKNKNSARVLEKNRFKLEGFLRNDRIKDGKLINVYLYARTK